MLVELLRFARWLALQRRQRVHTVQFHAPQWLIAQALGVHEDTVRRWLKRPEVQLVVRGVQHYTDGYYHRIVDGKVFAVALEPQEGRVPRITFERDAQLRDLERDSARGHVRGSYTPQEGSLSQVLQDWYQSQSQEPSVGDSRTPVENWLELLRDLRLKRTRERVTLAAKALMRALHDREAFLPGWCQLLWRLDPPGLDALAHLLARHRDADPHGLGRKVMLLAHTL
jgi:hypothetical protein